MVVAYPASQFVFAQSRGMVHCLPSASRHAIASVSMRVTVNAMPFSMRCPSGPRTWWSLARDTIRSPAPIFRPSDSVARRDGSPSDRPSTRRSRMVRWFMARTCSLVPATRSVVLPVFCHCRVIRYASSSHSRSSPQWRRWWAAYSATSRRHASTLSGFARSPPARRRSVASPSPAHLARPPSGSFAQSPGSLRKRHRLVRVAHRCSRSAQASRPARGGGRVELHGVAGQYEPGSGPFAQFGDGVQFRGADHARLVYDDELSGVDEAGLFPGVGFADGAAYPVAFGGGARRGEPAPVFASQVVGLRPVPFGHVVEELGDGDRVGADAVGELVPGPDGQGQAEHGSPPVPGLPCSGDGARMVVVFPVPAGPMSALAACGFSSRYAAAFAWSSLSRFPPARMDWMSRVPSRVPGERVGPAERGHDAFFHVEDRLAGVSVECGGRRTCCVRRG